MTRRDRERMARAAHRLADDDRLLKNLCTERPEWTAEVLRGLAIEGDLGWEDGALLFAYSHGIKRRWEDLIGRHFRWDCGGPNGECWRQSLLRSAHHTVYITEGETDAISLIACGIEDREGCLVVGLPGNTSYPERAPFRDKNIVLIPDPDQAGQDTARVLVERLTPVAASIITINVSEIFNQEAA
jgi:hypothetical protein